MIALFATLGATMDRARHASLARTSAPMKGRMNNPSKQSQPDVWATDGAEIERPLTEVEADGLHHSMAMGELPRSPYGLSQTLSGKGTITAA